MKMKKEERGALISAFSIIIFVLMTVLASNVSADIFMGTCEGYVKWLNGTLVTVANVTVTVQGCTTPPANCQRSALTDSGGYYVIANLNLPPYGNVSGTAVKGSAYGTNTAQADAYQAAFMNITLCESPSQATVVPVADSHYPNITFWFNWTSGSSPYSTFDQWFWLSSWQTANSPKNRTNLAFANYTWGARTCLSSLPSCCSQPAYDNFLVYNNKPCRPILQDQPDTTNNTVTLNWSYNTTAPCPDADNDSVYFNFQIDGNITTNATPPKTMTGIGSGAHLWGAQVCDPWECSDWVFDSFNIYNTACPTPNLTIQDNTCLNQATLRWTSAPIDPDGDPCFDEFRFGSIIQSPATSPQNVIMTNTSVYEWAVRSCDNKGACSPWNQSEFIYCTCGGNVTEVGRGGKGYECVSRILPSGYEIVVSKPKEIHPGSKFDLEINLKYFEDISDLKVEAETPPGIIVESLDYGTVKANQEINFKLKTEISNNIKEDKYFIFIKGYDGDKIITNKPVELNIVMPPVTQLIGIEVPLLPCCTILGVVLLIIALIILAWLLRKIYREYIKNKGPGKMISNIKKEL